MKKGFFLLLGIITILGFINTKPLADDTNEIIGKGYIFHLDSTQFNFSENETTKTVNYSVKFNGSGSISKINYSISANNINMVDKHNSNNKIPVTITGGSSGTFDATKNKAANTTLTTGSFSATRGTTTKAGEYVGKLTISFNLSYKCETAVNTVWEYGFKNSEQSLTVPCKGVYKLEVWGAQGGSNYGTGGYGAYSVGQVSLTPDTVLYIHTGGQPTTDTGGYNGGGAGNFTGKSSVYFSAGGGATHIATKSGLLKALSNDKNNVLIIAGGGGGSAKYSAAMVGGSAGGSAGGKIYYNDYGKSNVVLSGNSGATQSYSGKVVDSGWSYAITISESGGFGYGGAAAGGGYFGGARYSTGNRVYSGAGGSGWIGNSLLSSAHMTCFQCIGSSAATAITTVNSCYNTSAKTDCGKAGNGYAKITLISVSS